MSEHDAQQMVALFEKHVAAELNGDLGLTMATMTDHPHLINLPTAHGGVGRDEVQAFYRDFLVGKFFPPDVEMTSISRTVNAERIVDEMIIAFTHTQEIPWMLPGVAPTGKAVVAAFVVIVGVKQGKVDYEHIYWDQASVLVQIGVLKPDGLPVVGAENARKILDMGKA
jgi:carboxymethylenebutenolidase